MTAFTSAWFIGSIPSWETQNLVFTGAISGNGDISTSLGGLYLTHSTADLDSFGKVETLMDSLGGTSSYVRFNKNRKIELGHGGGNFTLTWPSATMRDFYGFDGDLSGASSYEAENVSPYFWSPGRPETPLLAPAGIVGRAHATRHARTAPGGRTTVSEHATGDTVNDFRFSNVKKERYWDTAANDEYVTAHATFFGKLSLFLLLRNIEEDDDSSNAATYDMADALGPYVLDSSQDGWREIPFRRDFASVDRSNSFTMHVHTHPEYS